MEITVFDPALRPKGEHRDNYLNKNRKFIFFEFFLCGLCALCGKILVNLNLVSAS